MRCKITDFDARQSSTRGVLALRQRDSLSTNGLMADTAGFEPAICGLGGHRLIQLGHVSMPSGAEPFEQPIAGKSVQK